MLSISEQRYASKYPLFYDIVKKVKPKYNSLQVTGNSKTRHLTYTYDNKNYERCNTDASDEALFGFLALCGVIFSSLLFLIPNVFWGNFCFYFANIILMWLGWLTADSYKEAIIRITIVFCEMLFVVGCLYWITKNNLHDANNLDAYKNITAIWPKFVFKFPFV
jgi:hypothetical protein